MILAVSTQLMSDQHTQVALIEDKLSRTSLNSDLVTFYQSPGRCASLLSGTPFTQTGRIQVPIRDLTGKVLFDPATSTNVPFDKLRIRTAYLENIDVSGPDSTGFANLTVELDRLRARPGAPTIRPIQLRTMVRLDADSKISGCASDGGGCLKLVSSHRVGASHPGRSSHFSSLMLNPLSFSIRVPEASTALVIELGDYSQEWRTGSASDNTDENHSCASLGPTLTLHAGAHLGSGIFEPGKILMARSEVTSSQYRIIWSYDGREFARVRVFPRMCFPWTVNNVFPGSLGATCPDAPPAELGIHGRVTVWQ